MKQENARDSQNGRRSQETMRKSRKFQRMSVISTTWASISGKWWIFLSNEMFGLGFHCAIVHQPSYMVQDTTTNSTFHNYFIPLRFSLCLNILVSVCILTSELVDLLKTYPVLSYIWRYESRNNCKLSTHAFALPQKAFGDAFEYMCTKNCERKLFTMATRVQLQCGRRRQFPTDTSTDM